jgi:hypothetical protein
MAKSSPVASRKKSAVDEDATDLAFVRLELRGGRHQFVPMLPDTPTRAARQVLVNTLREREMLRYQRRIFNSLVGPTQTMCLFWVKLPLDQDKAAESIRQVARALDETPNARSLSRRYAGLAFLPSIAVEHDLVVKKQTPGAVRRPGIGDDPARLPAVPISLEEVAENASLILASRLSSLTSKTKVYAAMLDFQDELRVSMVAPLETFLATLREQSWGLEGNRQFVSTLNKNLRALGLRAACTTCGAPSLLVIDTPSGMPEGAFQFRHSQEKSKDRTKHGGTSGVPTLQLVVASRT